MSDTCSTLEAAQRLRVSIQTVQRWVDMGQLRAWKTLGGHRRIETASVDALLRDRQTSLAQMAPIAQTAAAASREPGAPTVLVVDDDPNDRALMSMLASGALPKATVSTAASGFEALLAIGRAVPDVLITDVVMPHMNGFEMLRHLGSVAPVRPRLILVMSSYSVHELNALGSLPAGVQFLSKPIDGAAFTRLLHGSELLAQTLPAAPASPA